MSPKSIPHLVSYSAAAASWYRVLTSRMASAVGGAGMCPQAIVPAPLPGPAPSLQRHQPEGVPPLSLTGERTLPDVPEENYWFRRHLVVYEWIARQVAVLRVADLGCGGGAGPAGPPG